MSIAGETLVDVPREFGPLVFVDGMLCAGGSSLDGHFALDYVSSAGIATSS